MATDEQLRKYADSLGPLYREILAAFPRIEPNRKHGFGLAYQTLAADLERHLRRRCKINWRKSDQVWCSRVRQNAGFHRATPHSGECGYGLILQQDLKGIGLGEIIKASQELEKNDLAEIKNGIFVHPTVLGERLITIITGKQAPDVKVPKLPPLPR